MSSFFDKTSDALATSIKMRQLRQNVTQSNIANAETPHYKAQKLDFENALASSLETGSLANLETSHVDHISSGSVDNITPQIFDNPEVAINNDGNTVDLEKEMSALAENSILYKSALQLINKKMAAIKYALGDR